MEILIIGFSNIVQRRLIPALNKLDGITKIHIASRQSNKNLQTSNVKKLGEVITGYDNALDKVSSCLAYISLPNHLHGEWAIKALQAGFHVIIDKPAFQKKDEFNHAIALSSKYNLCLAESTVWMFHKQISMVQRILAEEELTPQVIQSVFSFPPLPKSNFRNDPKKGGGSFADLSAYAITPGRLFFKEKPHSINCKVLSRDKLKNIDTSFSLTSSYQNGCLLQGFFGFTTGYQNKMTIMGRDFSVAISPVFTMTDDVQSEVSFNIRNKTVNYKIDPSDMFLEFLIKVLSTIDNEDFRCWSDILKIDFELSQMAALSAGLIKYDN